MFHGNDRLSNLAVGAVVVIVFLLIGRLKRSLRKPPSEMYQCGGCRRMFRRDARTVKAWRSGFRKFCCPECHAAWRCKRDAEQFVRDQGGQWGSDPVEYVALNMSLARGRRSWQLGSW